MIKESARVPSRLRSEAVACNQVPEEQLLSIGGELIKIFLISKFISIES